MSLNTLISCFIRRQSPGQLIIQLTDKCNARCPQCAMRVTNCFDRSTLDIDRCKKIIDRAAKRGVRALSITGGEPLLFGRELISLIRHADKAGIGYSRTGTNGFMFRNPESPDFTDRVMRTVDMLATSRLRNFWISIDSSDPSTHEEMRGFSGMIRGLEKALPLFHRNGLYPTANLGINRNLGGKTNSLFYRGIVPETAEGEQEYIDGVKNGLDQFFTRVLDLGFTLANFCYPMSIEKNDEGLEAVYPASSVEHIVRFNEKEKSLIFSALLESIPQYRDKIRIFSPLCAIDTMQRIYSGEDITPFPCRGGIDYFFIASKDGCTYPCGYRGQDNLGDYSTTKPKLSDKRDCSRCDWECFRDPSELMGPFVHGLNNPLDLRNRYKRDKRFYKLWFNDLKYYRACDLFDGRKEIQPKKLQKAIPK